MAEQDKSLAKSSHSLTRFDPKARKELVIRGLNALSEVKDANYYFFIGEEHRIRGEFELAISYYEKALKIDSEHEDSLFWMGYCYSWKGVRTVNGIELDNNIRNERAAAAFQKLISIGKNRDSGVWSVPLFNLGLVQNELYLYDAAIENYERAIELNPDLAAARFNLGNTYLKLGRYQDAIESFKHAVRINPDYADAHYGLGGSYFCAGDKSSALEEYKILKNLGAKQADQLYKLIQK